jgi:hypothetical protein
MLDVARRAYLDTIEKIHELVHKYNETLEIPVKLNYTYVAHICSFRDHYRLIWLLCVADLGVDIISLFQGTSMIYHASSLSGPPGNEVLLANNTVP